MTRRPFVPWPDNRLRTAASTVDTVTDEIRVIWDEMVETMDASAASTTPGSLSC